MAFLVAEPQVMATAAGQVEEIGSAIGVANEFAAGSISDVAAAAGDEVSAAIASFFAAHGQAYQTMAGQVAAFHTEFQQALAQAGNAYVQAEAAGAAALAGALGGGA
ncbi:PE family protein, partial [Mycobacterium ulcerans]